MPVSGTFYLSDLLLILGALWPIFIMSFLFIASVINGALVKGFTYLAGVIFCIVLWFLIGKTWLNYGSVSTFCRISGLNLVGYNYSIPNLNIFITWFTNAYLFTSMFITNQFNPAISSVLLLGSFINTIILYIHGCIATSGGILGFILGIGVGIGWFYLYWATNNKNALYFSQILSNKAICSVPSKKSLICTKIFKNAS